MLRFALLCLVAVSSAFDVPDDQCGSQSSSCKWYSAPTHDVPEHCFPWVVSIRKNGNHVCAGAVYMERWIITSAQCVSNEPSAYTVVVGIHSLSAPVPDSNSYPVDDVIIHADYTGQPAHDFAENNIALLKLSRDVAFGEGDQSPCLPFANHKISKTSLVVAGWGDRNVPGYSKDTLQFMNEDTADVHYCDTCSEGSDFFGSGHDSALYVGKTSESVCLAGPGGPAFTLRHHGWTLIGIAARRIESSPCDADRHPAPLTDIAYHYGWIRQQVTA